MMHPYQLVKQRRDKVVRVPTWVQGTRFKLEKGDIVFRITADMIRLKTGEQLKVGESYTRFFDYKEI